MTTNTYQALCDDVGAYTILSNGKKQFCNYEGDCNFFPNVEGSIPCEELGCQYATDKAYPPQSSEQVLRLEELIIDKATEITTVKICNGVYCSKVIVGDTDRKIIITDWVKTKPEALYALTHKLVQEGVLSKEEVKEALTNV